MNAAWERRWPAPAKLNLMLHVVGRRADGYHLLQTVFRLIDLADTLAFAPRDDRAIRIAAPLAGVPEDADLSVRAARLLQAETGCDQGATIAIDKRIPVGGGLGGGSSDAATTLIALNELWGTGLNRADLARYVVIAPQVAVSTREIFASSELTRDTKPLRITAFFAGLGRNDLEPVVRARFPEVARAIDWLASRGDARMSGSGSSVFAAFEHEHEARAVAAKVPGEWRAWAVRGLDRHPLGMD
jgi:4-diphosphocytidyl-2-C-methyl-D-erythritol kinase